MRTLEGPASLPTKADIGVTSALKGSVKKYGSFEFRVGNAAHEACGLKLAKSSLPAMRKSTVRMVVKRV
jgi:hypothetical protein